MPRASQVPESEIELIRNGEARSVDIARKWGVSRQAVSSRVYYRPARARQRRETGLKRWLLLFLYRIGVSSYEIAEILNYKRLTAKTMLKAEWGVTLNETFYYPKERVKGGPQLRRWSAFFLMRLGFEDDEVAELTGYALGSVKRVYRTWFRQMVRGRKEVIRQAHTLEIEGSTPSPASKKEKPVTTTGFREK